jgi:hypothetical protein
MLLAARADVNALVGRTHKSALHMAVGVQNREVVVALLQRGGAKLATGGTSGSGSGASSSVLHACVDAADVDGLRCLIDVLVEAKQQALLRTTKDAAGRTALQHAGHLMRDAATTTSSSSSSGGGGNAAVGGAGATDGGGGGGSNGESSSEFVAGLYDCIALLEDALAM